MLYITKAIKATKTTSEVKSVGKFCMLKMRYATETSRVHTTPTVNCQRRLQGSPTYTSLLFIYHLA